MSEARGAGAKRHKELKNRIRKALGELDWVACFNNESGVAFHKSSTGVRCSECGGPKNSTPVRYGLGKGGSDLICIVKAHDGRGIFVALEVKTGAGVLSLEQKMFLELIERFGGVGREVRSTEEACMICLNARGGAQYTDPSMAMYKIKNEHKTQ